MLSMEPSNVQPVAVESEAPAPATEGEATDSSPQDFINLGEPDDFDFEGLVAPEPGATEPPSAIVSPVMQPGVTPPAPAPVAAQAPATSVPPQGQQPQSASSPQPTAQPVAPVDTLEALEANRDEIIAALAQEYFQLSSEDVEALQVEAGPVVAKLLARLYFMTSANGLRQLKDFAATIPGMIQQFQTVQSANQTVEQRFYEMHPVLKADKAKYESQIKSLASALKASSP